VGEQQAHAVGTRIRDARMAVDVILVSPLTRALQTATLMFVDELKSRNPPRFVAIELCREAFGGHPCDQRRTRSELHRDFPHVDFSLVETDEDTWHNPEKRETVREVALRCDKMLDVLRARQERNIALVSHGVFLETLLNRCSLACVSEDVRSRRFDNAELRSIVIGGWSPVQTAHAGPQGGGGAAPRH
jgi:broad specificity phosphatase PhoE